MTTLADKTTIYVVTSKDFFNDNEVLVVGTALTIEDAQRIAQNDQDQLSDLAGEERLVISWHHEMCGYVVDEEGDSLCSYEIDQTYLNSPIVTL